MMEAQTLKYPFLDRTYVEALGLLTDARDYIGNWKQVQQQKPDPFKDFLVIWETTRLVAQLTSVVTWLAYQKAAENGEMSLVSANAASRKILDQVISSDDISDTRDSLPDELRDIIQRSLLLYLRVDRLDTMVRNNHVPDIALTSEGLKPVTH